MAAPTFCTPCTALADGPACEALRQAAADLGRAEAGGQPHTMSQALAQLARCYRGLGAAAAAEATLLQALRWSRLTGSVDLTVDLLCTLCETAVGHAEQQDDGDRHSGRGHAARELARAHAFEAAQCAGSVADARWEVSVLLRISDVLDRCGDRHDALALQTRALRLINRDLAPEPAGWAGPLVA